MGNISSDIDGLKRSGSQNGRYKNTKRSKQIFDARVLVGAQFLDSIDKLPKGKKRNQYFFLAGALFLLILVGGFNLVNYGQKAKKQILGATIAGLGYLETGKGEFLASNFTDASGAFQSAADVFTRTRNQIAGPNSLLNDIVKVLPVGKDIDKLLGAGAHVSQAMIKLSDGVQEFQSLRLDWDESQNMSGPALFEGLKLSRAKLLDSAAELSAAVDLLAGVNPGYLPSGQAAKFQAATAELYSANSFLQALTAFQGFAMNLLGGQKKTYILIFQNNNETRATGGFIGTYGILNFENGRMRLSKIESIYALDGQLKERIAAPGPLQRQETPDWGMRDANWFVDFPAASRNIISFFEKESGQMADGVISFTPDVFEKLLAITGPVAMPDYNVVLDAGNFRSTVQFKTSVDYDKTENQPKKFLSDFVPRFLDKLQALGPAAQLDVFGVLTDTAAQKQILMNSLDPQAESSIRDFGFGGEIKSTTGDYLAVFHSNVGGGKTDQSITQKIEKRVTIKPSGKTIVDLKITRTHLGFDEKYFPENLDFMRMLVPYGSTLLGASGFDNHELLPSARAGSATDDSLAAWDASVKQDERTGMYVGEEAGYTEFSNWLELMPGQSKTVTLSYELPSWLSIINGATKYSQVLQKQPGARTFDFDLTVIFPNEIGNFYPPEFQVVGHTLHIAEAVQTDRFYLVNGGQ